MTMKSFSEQLNKVLDEMDFPREIRRREELFAKLVGIPREPARRFLCGYAMPNELLLYRIARELDVKPQTFKDKYEKAVV